MPPLNEGSLLFMPVLLPSTSLTEVKRIMAWQDRVIRTVPEVESVAGKLGRAETPTDPAPVEMIETTIMLKPVESLASRNHPGEDHCRAFGKAQPHPWLCARIFAADREPDSHAQHRNSGPGGH